MPPCFRFLFLYQFQDAENLFSPTFPSQVDTFEILESAEVGDSVFTCTATDNDTTATANVVNFQITGTISAKVTFKVLVCH